MRIPLALIALMSVGGCNPEPEATSDPDAIPAPDAAPTGAVESASLPQPEIETAAATPAEISSEEWGILEAAQAKPKPRPKPKPKPKPNPKPDPCPACGMG